MTWQTFPWGPAIAALGVVSAVLLLALDERNRRRFATREDVYGPDGRALRPSREEVQGIIDRIDVRIDAINTACERTSNLFVSLDDRVGQVEGDMAIVKERQTQQWQNISEQMSRTARTLEEVTKDLRIISEKQHAFALDMERARRMRTEGDA